MSDLIEKLQHVSEKLKGVNDGAAKRLDQISQSLTAGSLTLPIDIHHVLDPAGIEEQAIMHSQRYWYWLGWLEWVRNVLVLLPVALTWLGLAAAAANYRDAVTAVPELAGEPFLKLWELRFEGHGSLPGPTFSELAFVAFFLLAGVIFLTVLVHLWRDVKVDQAHRAAGMLRQDVESILWQLTLQNSTENSAPNTVTALNSLRQTLEGLRTHVDEMLNVIVTENARADRHVQLRQQEVNDLRIFSEGMGQVSTDLIRQGQELRQVYQQLLIAVERLALHVEQINTEEQRVVASFDSLHTRSASLLGSVQTLGKRVEEGIHSLRLATANGTAHTNTIIATVETLRDVTAAVVEGDQQLRQALLRIHTQNENIAAQLTSTVTALERGSQNSGNIVDSMNMVSHKLDIIVAEYRQTNTQTLKVITSFDTISARLLNAIVDVAGQTTTLNNTISSSLADINQRVNDVEKRLTHGASRSATRNWPKWLILAAILILAACGTAVIFIIQGGYLP